MDEATWLGSANWLQLWHYVLEKDFLTDRKRRLLAVASCRGLLYLVADVRLLRMIGLAEEWADAPASTLNDEWWDRREDWLDEASDAASGTHPGDGAARRAAAWAFVGLGNDDHKVGRSVESASAAYGCPVGTDNLSEGHCAVIAQAVREVVGNPFRPVVFDPSWRTSTVVALAEQMYGSRDFAPMPVLADALQDAGCDNEDILSHCRGAGPHVRGCWVVDLILGKQ